MIQQENNQEHVLLIHGLAENSLWMRPLEFSLLASGYRTHQLDYPSTRKSVEELTWNELDNKLSELSGVRALHIVTHSMGGVMVRNYLPLRRSQI